MSHLAPFQLGELVRRIGTVSAMSAWKPLPDHRNLVKARAFAATGNAGRPALTGFWQGPVFWLPGAYGFLGSEVLR